MGMTIDDHIEVLKSYNHGFTGYAGNLQDSIDVAVDIMRKYQKIKNIICKWEDGLYDDEGVSYEEVLDMISNEVNGDGDDD